MRVKIFRCKLNINISNHKEMKIEICKESVEKRLARLSAATHYYSQAPSGADAESQHRAPLFTAARSALIDEWYEQSCSELAVHLQPWTLEAAMLQGVMTLTLRPEYESVAHAAALYAERYVTLGVWVRMTGLMTPQAATIADAERQEALMQMLSALVIPAV